MSLLFTVQCGKVLSVDFTDWRFRSLLSLAVGEDCALPPPQLHQNSEPRRKEGAAESRGGMRGRKPEEQKMKAERQQSYLRREVFVIKILLADLRSE